MNLGKVTFNHTCKNESERYVLVGNCADFISDHATLEEANTALDKISIGESKWSRIHVLAPGEEQTIQGLERHIYEKQSFTDDSVFEIK